MDKVIKESNLIHKKRNLNNKTRRVYQKEPILEKDETFVKNSRPTGQPKKIWTNRSKI